MSFGGTNPRTQTFLFAANIFNSKLGGQFCAIIMSLGRGFTRPGHDWGGMYVTSRFQSALITAQLHQQLLKR